MPERHSSGSDSSNSSSSSSSGSSWSSSSSRSSSSWSSGGNYSNRPTTPWDWAVGILALVILLGWLGGTMLQEANKKSEKDRQNREATMTTQAITITDLQEMHTALDKHIPLWKETADRTVHRVSAEAADFGPASNTKEVDYGYCNETDFYVYVLENSRPGGFTLADTEGYAYTADTTPRSCLPDGWNIVEQDWAAESWYFVTLRTSSATYAAQQTLTPIVTLSPQPTDSR